MPDLYAQIIAEVDRRLTRAAVHLTGKVKEVLSVPAPRVQLNDKHGTSYYVAGWEKNMPMKTNKIWSGSRLFRDKKTKLLVRNRVNYEPSFATPGAPPRKLSGRLRASVTWESLSEFHKRVGTNVVYGKPLERMGHLFLQVTMNAERVTLERIING